METKNIKKIYELLNQIPVTEKNQETIAEVKECLLNGDFITALQKIQDLQLENEVEEKKQEEIEMVGVYPKQLSNPELEYIYMGLLLNDPKLIVKYYFLNKECYFEEEDILNLYKSILFTEGGNYTPEIAKKGFNALFLICHRVNAYLFTIVFILELDFAVHKREQRVVAAASDVVAGVNFRSALTYENITGQYELTVRTFYAEALRVTVASVFGGTAALFVSE